ncbi:hypothetical protein GW17_00040303, partial [Ensete ventricosum]
GADASDGRGSLAADACGCDPDVAGESASRGFQSTVAPFRTRACRSLLSAFGESWHFFNQVLYVVIGIMFAGKWTQFIADSSPADAAYESGGLKPEVLRSSNPYHFVILLSPFLSWFSALCEGRSSLLFCSVMVDLWLFSAWVRCSSEVRIHLFVLILLLGAFRACLKLFAGSAVGVLEGTFFSH